MAAFDTRVRIHGRTFNLSEIEEFCRRARANGCLGETLVDVHKEQSYNNPTDPGGEITISVGSAG